MEFRYPVYQKTQGVYHDSDAPASIETAKTRSFHLSLGNILPCPFCASEKVELGEDSVRYGYGSYERFDTFYAVRCKDCGAKGKAFYQKPLRSFTEYTVQDFRDNPILRAKVEDEYSEYIDDMKLDAVKAWNIRRLDTDDL